MLQVKYHSMSKEEQGLIAKAQAQQDLSILYNHSRLRDIANQGVINVNLGFADKLVAASWWKGPRKQL